jgi:hypothetical protein
MSLIFEISKTSIHRITKQEKREEIGRYWSKGEYFQLNRVVN